MGESKHDDGRALDEPFDQPLHAERGVIASKHTPGPWIRYGGGKRRWAIGRAGGGFCLCQMTRHNEAAANARLIAAAPDLLAACEAAEPFVRRFIALQRASGIDTTKPQKALSDLRAAITLAKGAH